MSEMKTFRADSMREALTLVRRELGPDALIVQTRQVPKKSLLPWQQQKVETEIVAVREESPGVRSELNSRRETAAGQTTNSSAATRSTAAPVRSAEASRITPTLSRRNYFDESRTEPTATVTAPVLPSPPHKPLPSLTPPPATASMSASRIAADADETTPAPIVPSLAYRPTANLPTESQFPETSAAAPDSIAIVATTASAASAPISSPELRSAVAPSSAANNSSPIAKVESVRLESLFQERFANLEQMVQQLTEQIQLGHTPAISADWLGCFRQLQQAEVEPLWASELVQQLERNCAGEPRLLPSQRQYKLQQFLETKIRCRGPIRPSVGKQKVVALVGPTGVGKTTTIAKLAANFRLHEQQRLGLITVDTYRIAAVEQLKTYAELIDLPMKVVTRPDQMPVALAELAACDLVLIDTAGRSPRDEVQIHELQSYLSQIVIDETHLVLSATTGARQLTQTIDKFRPVHPTACVLTKLDETAVAGAVLNVAGRSQLPISYFTTGQNVPRDIEAARPDRAVLYALGTAPILTSPR